MIRLHKDEAGLEYLEIENRSATAKVALQGAHLFHYQQTGQNPLLWLSKTSHFKTGKAIRGGTPVCWPWFGKHPDDASLPQHGFARTSLFKHIKSHEPDGNSSEITLQLQSSAQTLALWPYEFELLVHIVVGPTLNIALSTTNRSNSPFALSSALHSYFLVSDIGDASIQGLDNTEYWDALTDETHVQSGDIHITAEVDRVYQNVTNFLQLNDLTRTIQIKTSGSSSAIVWNPWIDKTRSMSDMENDGYKTMLCIETANAREDTRTLAPGSAHTLQCTYSCST